VTPAKRKGSRVTPKKHTPAKPSPSTSSRRTKGRIPVAEPGAKGSGRAGPEPGTEKARATDAARAARAAEAAAAAEAADAEASDEVAGSETDRTSGVEAPAATWWQRLITPRPPRSVAATAEVVDAEDTPVVKRTFTGWRLVLVFLGAQIAGLIAYSIAQSSTDYDFQIPPGTGAAVGQAAGQAATGQAIDIAIAPPIWITMLMQLPLWAVLGGVPVYLAVTKGRGVVAELGLRMKAIDVPVGLAIGAACQMLMVPALYWLVFKAIGVQDVSAAARELTDRATDPLSILLVFLIVIVGAPVAEELFFRGMAQRTFLHKLRPRWAILASSAFFAISHFQPLQFPALLVFGLILGWLTWKADRLGPAIWAHVGFNAVTAISLIYHVGWW
jgi:membrane protease YdiL (CAAX protease family)